MSGFDSRQFTKYADDNDPLLEISTSSIRRRSSFSGGWRVAAITVCAIYPLDSAPVLVILTQKYVPQPYSPGRSIITYHRQDLYFGEDEKYTERPEDVDEAWDYLLEPINIRATKDELQQACADIRDDIVKLPDGDYVAVLSVYHELHCLNALPRNIFPQYYYPNARAAEKEYNILHMTHCVDTIRRSLMCKADLALYTAYWIAHHTALPSKELRSNSDTVCVDWGAVDRWTRSRLLPKDKYKIRPGPFENQPE